MLVVIEAHTFDSWTMASERARPWFGELVVLLAGMAAPLFLFLAGVAGISLSAASQIRRGAARKPRSRRAARLAAAPLSPSVRLQSFVLGGFKAPRSLLKVDILNVMGPAVALHGRLWGADARVGAARPG